MSDKLNQGGDSNQTGGADDRHEAARHMAEAAMRAEAAGDTHQAEVLLDQAERTDPAAVIDVVAARADLAIPGAVDDAGLSTMSEDAELSTMSETVQPGSDAPSRAGISGSGSGADNQGL